MDRSRSAREDDYLTSLVFSGERDEFMLPAANVNAVVAQLRLIKDEDEIRRMRAAINLTAESLVDVMGVIKPGMTEYQVEGLIENGFRSRGAERLGFPSIVGSGPNSTTLHYDKNRRTIAAGDLVVMDVGGEYGYYSADVTRTVPIDGKFTPRQRQIYELVLATQQVGDRFGAAGNDRRAAQPDHPGIHEGALGHALRQLPPAIPITSTGFPTGSAWMFTTSATTPRHSPPGWC